MGREGKGALWATPSHKQGRVWGITNKLRKKLCSQPCLAMLDLKWLNGKSREKNLFWKKIKMNSVSKLLLFCHEPFLPVVPEATWGNPWKGTISVPTLWAPELHLVLLSSKSTTHSTAISEAALSICYQQFPTVASEGCFPWESCCKTVRTKPCAMYGDT